MKTSKPKPIGWKCKDNQVWEGAVLNPLAAVNDEDRCIGIIQDTVAYTAENHGKPRQRYGKNVLPENDMDVLALPSLEKTRRDKKHLFTLYFGMRQRGRGDRKQLHHVNNSVHSLHCSLLKTRMKY